MSSMPVSPSPLLYFVGRGILKGAVDPDNPTVYRDFGNCPFFQTVPRVTRIKHQSSRLGVRFTDFSAPQVIEMSINFHLDEWGSPNLNMAMLGELTSDTIDTINILEAQTVTGALRLIGTNVVGQKFQVDVPDCKIDPTGNQDWIGDGYGVLEFVCDVLGDTTTGIFGTVRGPITTELT